MNNTSHCYCFVRNQFGYVGIVWSPRKCKSNIQRVFLPSLKNDVESLIKHFFPQARYSRSNNLKIVNKIDRYLKGEKILFTIEELDFSRFNSFQRMVLIAEREIPYGRVTTYGYLACNIGRSGAARAVGSMLARNPFPLVIPCHRTICADGSLGGFQGGIELKRRLLRLEGVGFTQVGKINLDYLWLSK